MFRPIMRTTVLLCSILWATPTWATPEWDAVLDTAKGETVYWNAWGGNAQYNEFIDWVAMRVAEEYEITLNHVRLSDTADAVRTVLAEKQAGADRGSIDLIWINGENFNTMKQNDLLFGSFAWNLPNFALVNPEKNPATVLDFGVPTEGYESPWGMARFNFMYDSARIANPPRSAAELLDYARSNPGRVTYPAPPDFTGLAFLKQVLLEVTDHDPALYAPADPETYLEVIQPLTEYMTALDPYLWREGEDFPANETALLALLNDNAVDFAMSYNIGAVTSAIVRGDLPETAQSLIFDGGTLGNVNFVTIPFNSPSPDAAMVVANFLLSPEAQARRENPEIWGDRSVLDKDVLTSEQSTFFLPPSYGMVQDLGKTLSEPHPDWSNILRDIWLYGEWQQ